MRIHYSPKAEERLCDMSARDHDRIVDKMDFFAEQKGVFSFAKKLTGRGSYRFRIGGYRAICDISDGLIDVLVIEKRDKVYD